ncbi:MAG: response regulator [Polyangiaceae bacterium]
MSQFGGQAAHVETQPTRRVLVCDDEDRLGELTAGLLRQFGYDARAVVDGAEAIAQSAAEPGFGVMILDVSLRGTSSFDVLARLAELRPGMRVVLSSGYPEEDVPSALLRQPNVVGYLPKPYPVERLIEAVVGAFARA